MRSAPVSPEEYAAGDDEAEVITDEMMAEESWAMGLNVWGVIGKACEWAETCDNDSGRQNAQLWSFRKAIRAELLAELGMDVSKA